MTRPSAWIFDFNGTLVFDSIYHEQAWNRYMEGRLGRVVPREEFLAHVHGRTNRDILTYLLGRCPTQAEADAAPPGPTWSSTLNSWGWPGGLRRNG